MNSYISLTHGDLLLASIFLAMNAVFSILLSLRLERQLIVSALRMITQLFLVGLVLKTIFTLSSLWLTLLAAAVMVTFAGREIWARQDRRLSGVWGIGLGGTSMLLAKHHRHGVCVEHADPTDAVVVAAVRTAFVRNDSR